MADKLPQACTTMDYNKKNLKVILELTKCPKPQSLVHDMGWVWQQYYPYLWDSLVRSSIKDHLYPCLHKGETCATRGANSQVGALYLASKESNVWLITCDNSI